MFADPELELAKRVVATAWGRRAAVVAPLSGSSFNRFFRVDHTGARFALRLGAMTRVHVAGTEDVEAAWLDQLRSDGWAVPVALRNIEGAVTTEVEGRTFTLFTWARGQTVRAQPVDEAPERLGALMAQLHLQATAMPAVANQAALRFDRVTYLPDHDLVSGHDALLAEAVERAQEVIDQLWVDPPHEAQLIHSDIGTHNVMTWRNRLTPIDFQDLRFGFRQQDLAVTLADFDRGRPGWADRLLAGYATVAPLPNLPPELRSALRAARSLNIINLGLHPHGPGFDATLARHQPIVETWMRSDPG